MSVGTGQLYVVAGSGGTSGGDYAIAGGAFLAFGAAHSIGATGGITGGGRSR